MERYWKTVCDKHSPSSPLADVISHCDPDGTGRERERKRGKMRENEREKEKKGDKDI